MSGKINPDSLVTLHYRMAVTADGHRAVSTFESKPATLQLGKGELAPALEICLIGLAVGDRTVFELEPERPSATTRTHGQRFKLTDLPDDIELKASFRGRVHR
jgi:FKBP-type peptidyl-prolyl cis-trans isomerase SlpA